MYKRVRLKDTVEVPPKHLADVTDERVKALPCSKTNWKDEWTKTWVAS